jgi:hypothetical protein
MAIRISACTDDVFLESVMPMAHLRYYSLNPVNDNVFTTHPQWKVRLHFKRGANLAHRIGA